MLDVQNITIGRIGVGQMVFSQTDRTFHFLVPFWMRGLALDLNNQI